LPRRSKRKGYATGQFGKNHLGDLNEVPTYRPRVRRVSSGIFYHLDAMEDPAHPNYPQDLLKRGRPRNMSLLGDATDARHGDARWGKIGKQKIEDAGHAFIQNG